MPAQCSGNRPNAFEIMMSAARKVVLPPTYEISSEQTLRGDHAIYNKLLEYCIRKIWGGAQILSQVLVEILLNGSLILCGPIFSGFDDWAKKHTNISNSFRKAHQYTVLFDVSLGLYI